jgi:hypothetical protein
MAFKNPFAGRMATQLQLQMQPNPQRSIFIQQLMARALQNNGRPSRSIAESADIASAPIVAALLSRQDQKSALAKQAQQQQLANQLVGNQMRTNIPLENLPNDQGQPQAPDVYSVPTEGPTGATRQALAGMLAQSPEAMGQMALSQLMPPAPKQLAPMNVGAGGAVYDPNTKQPLFTNPTVRDPIEQQRLDQQNKLTQQAQAETERHNRATEAAAAAKSGTVDTSDPVVQSWGQAVLAGNATMQQVPNQHRDSVSMLLTQMPTSAYSPQAASRFSMAANRISSNYIKLPQYELTANGLPYLQRIDAALKTPGSVSDQDLLDSLTKLNTAGNAITDAQVRLITDGKSWADTVNTMANKFQNGGVLSNNQREQIHTIANAIFNNYKKGYQPVYDQVTKQLKASGIPEAFWGIPDLNKLSDQAQQQPNPKQQAAPPAGFSGPLQQNNDVTKMTDEQLRALINGQ